jgi:hypothetical protein
MQKKIKIISNTETRLSGMLRYAKKLGMKDMLPILSATWVLLSSTICNKGMNMAKPKPSMMPTIKLRKKLINILLPNWE